MSWPASEPAIHLLNGALRTGWPGVASDSVATPGHDIGWRCYGPHLALHRARCYYYRSRRRRSPVMRPILLVTLFSLAAGAAIAQAPVKPSFALPTESVTIIATKPTEETIRSFVETRTTPTRIVGKMARWQQGVCPLTIGLGDKYAKYVTERVRAVAAAVGAPVATAPCKVNVEIVFTTTPQAFMDTTRKSAPVFLGYHDSA